jgi:hypothetical protein
MKRFNVEISKRSRRSAEDIAMLSSQTDDTAMVSSKAGMVSSKAGMVSSEPEISSRNAGMVSSDAQDADARPREPQDDPVATREDSLSPLTRR